MTIPKEFLVERQGKSFVLYAGLLSEAHQQGLKRIETELIQVPTKENGETAICRAVVETEKGVFSGLGDADPRNVSQNMRTVILRLSETRAKARALRDAVNVGVAALEELGDHVFDENDVSEDAQSKPEATQTHTTAMKPSGSGESIVASLREKIKEKEREFSKGKDDEPKPASEKQIGYLKGLLSKSVGDEQREICLKFFYKEHKSYKGLSMSAVTTLLDWVKSGGFIKEWVVVYEAYLKKKAVPKQSKDDFEQQENTMLEGDIPYEDGRYNEYLLDNR